MIHPRNKLVSGLLYSSYAALALHGTAVILSPPLSIIGFIGELTWLWGVFTFMGAVIAIVGYASGKKWRVVESFGNALAAYGLSTYLVGVSANLFTVEFWGRLPQATQLSAFILAVAARSTMLFVLAYRENKAEKALNQVVSSLNHAGN